MASSSRVSVVMAATQVGSEGLACANGVDIG
jgi:hypothetical protein